jgi:hypothetical protein
MALFGETGLPTPTQTRLKHRDIAYSAMTAGRIFLGLAMMPYAIDKLFDLQFKVPAWTYAQPLGSTRGSTLVWAMFGYSPYLQCSLASSN